MEWRLADAKNRFSELVTKALTVGPQRVRRRDQAVIVLSEDDYNRLIGKRTTLKDYLLEGPDLSDVDLRRDPDPMRDIAW